MHLPDQSMRWQASALVSIVADLNLEMYSLKRQESSFESLVRGVADVLGKHVQPDVVANCARTLVHCSQHGPDAIQVHHPAPAAPGRPMKRCYCCHCCCCYPAILLVTLYCT